MKPAASRAAWLAGICLLLASPSGLAQGMSVADRIAAAEDRAEAYRAENAQLKQTVATQSDALRRLDQQFQDLKAQLEQQQRDSTSLQEALQNSREEHALATSRLDSCVTETESLSSELDRQSRQLASYAEAGREQQQTLQEQRQALAATRLELEEARSHESRCEADVERLRSQLESQRAELDSCVADARQQQQQLVLLSSQAGASDNELAQLRERLAQAQERNREWQESHRALQNDARAQQQELMAMNQQAGIDAQSAQRLQAQLDHVRERNQALQQAVSACESRPAPQAPECPPVVQAASDNQEIAALRDALARANAEIRAANQRFNKELQIERTLHARSQVQMEEDCQARIEALRSQR